MEKIKDNRAGYLNQVAATATASSEPILKETHLITNDKRKMAVVCRKNLENNHPARWQ